MSVSAFGQNPDPVAALVYMYIYMRYLCRCISRTLSLSFVTSYAFIFATSPSKCGVQYPLDAAFFPFDLPTQPLLRTNFCI